jgi:hypothetical protein
MEPEMPGDSSHRGKFSIGDAVGRAMAKRIIELNHPDAMIIDNRPTVFIERRKPASAHQFDLTPKRRRTDAPTEPGHVGEGKDSERK